MSEILNVQDLCVSFSENNRQLNVLDHVSLNLTKGKTLGLVGESGCGKSVTSMSIMRLLPQPSGRINKGSVLFNDINLATASGDTLKKIRGNRISMIFQEPMTALNPVKSIGSQLLEVYNLHRTDLSNSQAFEAAVSILEKVGIPDASIRMNEFPHQLSGGMRQRVVIAMALACNPDILIADEPTTALDVTIQYQIIELMKSIQKEFGMAILLITHDLGVVAELCDDVSVMYAGRIVEQATVHDIFSHPKHPYTQGLLNSIPRLTDKFKEQLNTIDGQVPSLNEMPKGCRFSNRCPYHESNCDHATHELFNVNNKHLVNCHKWESL